MDTKNEFEDTRDLLSHAPLRTAPAGLEQKIMNRIIAFDDKRRGERRALTSWLRFIAVGLVVVLVARVIVSQMNWNFAGKLTADDVAGWAGKSGDAGRWLADHCYYLLPLALLFFRRRMPDQRV
jgi:hypothetical protein